MLRAVHFPHVPERIGPMYKEFLGEVVVWLIPVVILVGIALLVTSHA
ncbi:hypothetical protein GCM10009530_55200 [Microbispora corallina]